jgi:TonB family protein
MWWLISRVQLARETVVDDLSILTTNSRRAYLDALLAFADDSGFDPSPAFSARRHLFHRVMLLSKEARVSSIRIAASCCVLAAALAAGSWEAVKAFPLHGGTVVTVAPPAHAGAQTQKPPRDPRTAADYRRIAQEYWEKANRDLSLTPEQKLETIRAGIEMEDRALAINPDDGGAQMSKSLFLRLQARLTPDAETQTKLLAEAEELRKSALANSPPPPPPAPPPPGSRNRGDMPPPPPPPPLPGPAYPSAEEFERLAETLSPVRIGGQMKTPVKVHDVKPVYPSDARAARVQGVVIIEAIIDASGDVAAARVLRSIPMLDDAALEAVRQWQFSPLLVDGVSQPMRMTVTVNFTLQ